MARYLLLLLLRLSLSNLSLKSFVTAIEEGEGEIRRSLSHDSMLRGVEGQSLEIFISNVLSEELAGCSLGLVLGEGDEDGKEVKEQEEEKLYVASVLRDVLATSNPRQVCFLVKLVVSVMTRLKEDGCKITRAYLWFIGKWWPSYLACRGGAGVQIFAPLPAPPKYCLNFSDQFPL